MISAKFITLALTALIFAQVTDFNFAPSTRNSISYAGVGMLDRTAQFQTTETIQMHAGDKYRAPDGRTMHIVDVDRTTGAVRYHY